MLVVSNRLLATGLVVLTALTFPVFQQPVQASEKSHASVGTQIAPADTPLNLLETPHRILVSTNSPYTTPYLLSYDERHHRVISKLELPELWYGLAYQPSSKVLLASAGTRSVWAVPFDKGVFGTPRQIVLKSCDVTAGLAIDSKKTALVACNESQQIVRFDFTSGQVLATAKVGEFPYAVQKLSSGEFAVSNWGQASISILKGPQLKLEKTIPVGSHPTQILALTRKGPLLVACSDSDLISVIDLPSLKETRRVDVHIPGSRLGGAQLNALAFDNVRHRLFAALAAINAVAVFQMEKDSDDPELDLHLEGLLPVGTYPSALVYSRRSHALYIADGRNPTLGPNTPYVQDYLSHPEHRKFHSDSGSKLDYVGYLLGGGLESIPQATLNQLKPRMVTLAQQIYGTKPEVPSARTREMVLYFSAKSNPDPPIRHVVYVMKENRTYDQVLGDMPEGNGASDLTLFGESVTPNEHALARQFVLFDNFYTDGDVSWNGQLWSMAAQSTDFVDKFWPSTYSGHVKFPLWGSVYRGDSRHDQPVGVPAAGFLWTAAHKADITYRDYGIWCVTDPKDPNKQRAWVRDLVGHYDPLYPPDFFDDLGRLNEWEREFHVMEKTGDMPALTFLYLGGDHTAGTRPGSRTPRALVASNDLAVGRLIDDLSHSRFWPHTAVFILEDDSQDGPDHVDCHRSPLFVVSPYIQHGIVAHEQFSTVSVLKTIEQILGLDSLTYFDDRAPSLLGIFQKTPDLEPFTYRPARVPLNEYNSPNAPGAKLSASWDFSHADSAPDQALNRVIWQSVKGSGSEPPAPIYSVRIAGPVRSHLP